MMKRIIIGASLLLLTLAGNAQRTLIDSGFDQMLDSIVVNNNTLKAYREKANADKIGNRTTNNLGNPEVEFGYAWVKPGSEGKEKTLGVTQSFDFPTAYRNRSKLINEQNKQVDLVYEQQRRDILQQARVLGMELIYQLKQNEQLTERLTYARELSDSYEQLFAKGSINILERNKTKLNRLTAEKAKQISDVEIEATLAELKRLNGGSPVGVLGSVYPKFGLPLVFDEWFVRATENNPNIQLAMQEVTISKRDEQLTRSLNFPKLSAGYTSEYTPGVSQHGFKVGVSIPLWGGRNTVKHKKAQTNALNVQLVDERLQFRNSVQKQYDRAVMLSGLLRDYESALETTNNRQLLQKAMDMGQLSLINYLLELEVYYDTIDSYLETEKEYQLALGELMQWDR